MRQLSCMIIPLISITVTNRLDNSNSADMAVKLIKLKKNLNVDSWFYL